MLPHARSHLVTHHAALRAVVRRVVPHAEDQDLLLAFFRLSPLLEAAEDAGIDVPFECRSGICGQCRVTLLAGRVEMACDEPLSREEREQGVILACQAKPITDVILDA